MFRKSLISAATLAAMISAAPAFAVDIPNTDAGHGTITFTGSVVEAPCSISPETQNIQVDLGQVSTRTLKADGNTSAPQAIHINLSGCAFEATTTSPPTPDHGQLSKVGVEFSGFTPVTGKTGYIPNTASDKASNVDIQILDSSQKPLDFSKWNEADNQIQLSPGSNSLTFWAQMIASGQATQGNVGATITYKLKYF